MRPAGHVVALCGGVGGAKLAFGLTRLLPPDRLSIVVNTGDDFEHLGLSVSPDIDTVIYTLADLADRVRGWGLAGESWAFMDALRAIGGEAWFNLGDRDLATHVERTRRLRGGETLSDVTAALARAHGIVHPLMPMSDDPVRTVVETDDGPLAFQHYFVREQCRPAVRAIRFEGAGVSKPAPGVSAMLARDDVGAVIICPSNPWLSVDPILSVPGLRDGLVALGAPIVAVSPIIGGAAVKGPAAKLMAELGLRVDQHAIASHYSGFADTLVIDETDVTEAYGVRDAGLQPHVAPTLMKTDEDRLLLARTVLAQAGVAIA